MGDADQHERRRVLERVLRAEPSIREDVGVLRGFPFDACEPLALLTLDIARGVLARHADGQITDEDLVAWADALEIRDDVALEPAFEDTLRECLFELAEPVLTGKPTSALAAEWSERLGQIPAR